MQETQVSQVQAWGGGREEGEEGEKGSEGEDREGVRLTKQTSPQTNIENEANSQYKKKKSHAA